MDLLQWLFGNTPRRARYQPLRDPAREKLHRAQLKAAIPLLLATWEPRLGVKTAAWGVKRMRTRWGSCNPAAKRIWLALALATKPPECLEYVVVHELVHLLEPSHNARFKALMTQHLPDWSVRKAKLNAASPST
ncbi:MAG: YgjP-like metallopeptidase domain-containing protein [Spirochaetales bacterium]